MKLRDFIIGAIVGAAAVVIAKEVVDRTVPYKSADAVLAKIKEQFKQDGPIDGTWVYMKPEDFNTGYATVPAYRGGITRIINDEPITFEFVADAVNGLLLDVQEV